MAVRRISGGGGGRLVEAAERLGLGCGLRRSCARDRRRRASAARQAGTRRWCRRQRPRARRRDGGVARRTLSRNAGSTPRGAAVRRLWATRLHADASAPQHPKSALQEWAAANNRGTPVYALVDRAGPGHAPRFTVTVRLGGNEAQGEGASKQEAETSAARTLLASVTTQKPAVRRRRPDARPARQALNGATAMSRTASRGFRDGMDRS